MTAPQSPVESGAASGAGAASEDASGGLPPGLVAWKRSTLGRTLRIAVIALLAIAVLYVVVSLLPWTRTTQFGLCVDTVTSSNTYQTASPKSPNKFVEVPRTENEVHKCGLPTMPSWTVIAYIVLVGILIVPELMLHFENIRLGVSAGGSSVNAELTHDRLQALAEGDAGYNPENPTA